VAHNEKKPGKGRNFHLKDSPAKNNIWLKPLILIVIVGGLAVLLYKTGWVQFFLDRERLTRFLESLGPWSFAGFLLVQILQVVAAPIPGELVGFLGGYLYGPLLGIVLNTIGLTIGSVIAFLLSRTFGRPAVDRFVDPKTMERFDFLLHHKGAFLVFLLFLLPGFPKDYLCYILGLGHLTLLEFVVIGGLGRLLGTVMLTLGGSFLRDRMYVELSLLAGGAVVIIFVVLAYKDKMERWLASLHQKK
jgi:uncharacterized membrane protein YdjX (TVP38/TMEM64 family)